MRPAEPPVEYTCVGCGITVIDPAPIYLAQRERLVCECVRCGYFTALHLSDLVMYIPQLMED